jgi:hypothetical protein
MSLPEQSLRVCQMNGQQQIACRSAAACLARQSFDPALKLPLCCLGAIRHVFAAVLVVYLRSTTPFDCHQGLVPALER